MFYQGIIKSSLFLDIHIVKKQFWFRFSPAFDFEK
jgi:hypothetical protein